MSTTIDNRVLEMRFDNAQFEKGVSESMSTLDKLKQKLKLSDASKGLEGINKAAKNVDMSGLSRGIETVQAKFSAMQVVGITALTNITNQAVNAGKRIVSALTIDPVKTGFQEYETQINSIQTILSNTQKEGTNIATVNKALDELNTYADKTIYNFTEMTRNIGTFTAAGVKLDTSVSAIQGIANLAAMSGSTSQQASTAMYQLSQALATGTVRLMDWNSVVNAGMGGQLFQDALKETSELLGTGAEAAIKAQGSFRESLQTGWLTSEVLTETLKKFTTSGANEYVAKYTGLSKEAVESALEAAEAQYGEAEAIEKASEALAKKSGRNKDEIKQALEFAKSAEDAATKVKTLTQLWDTLKEAAQSGWSQTWRIIAGDFEEAKELFSDMSDFLGGIIGKSADKRNKILKGALSDNPFSKIAEKINKVTSSYDKLSNATEKVKKVTEDYSKVVDRIIGGEFGNGEARIKALTDAGYDWAHAQNLVNEKLGDSTRHATKYKESQDEVSKSQEKVNKTRKVTIEDLVKMSDAQLKQLEFTEDEIEAFRELENQSKKTGIPLKDLVKDIDQLNGRTLLINSFKNAGKGLVSVFEAVGKAWKDIFWNGASDDEIIARKTEMLYNAIAALHKFSTYLTPDKLPIDQITRSLKGLFAIIDIITTIVGGGFKLAFKALSKVLGAFDMNILDLTANLGDAIVKFRDFLFNNDLINKGFELLADALVAAAKAVKEFAEAVMNLPFVQGIISGITDAFNNLKNIDLREVGQNIIAGLQNGLGEGISGVISAMIDIGSKIIEAICGILGIESPSKVMIAIGGFIIAGLVIGLKNAFPEAWDAIVQFGKDFISRCKETFNDISWGKIIAGGISASMIYFVKKMSDAIGGISSVAEGLGDVLSSAAGVIKKFGKVLSGLSLNLKAKAVKQVAMSLLMIVAAVAIISFLDIDKMWNAVAIIGALSLILVGLAVAMDKLTKASIDFDGKNKKFNMDGLKSGILQIGAALLMLAVVVKLVGSMNPDQVEAGFVGLLGIMTAMGIFLAAVDQMGKNDGLKNAEQIGKMMKKLAVSMLLMVLVVKLVGKLSAEEMIKGGIFVGAFSVFVKSLVKVAKESGEHISKVGGMAIKLTIAMALLVGVCKLVGKLSPGEMIKGGLFAAAFAIFVKYLVNIAKKNENEKIAKISGLVLSLSLAMVALIGVCKLVGMLSPGEMIKGTIFVGAFLIFVKAIVSITTISSESKTAKVAETILAISIAVGILAALSIVMSLIDLASLAKGVTAVGILSIFMTGMIKALKGARNIKSSLIILTVAIGVMAVAVASLSLIDTDKLAVSTAALVSMMLAFSQITKSLKGMENVPMKPIIVMVGVVAALGGILAILSLFNVDSSMDAAVSISLLMLTLAATMKIIDRVGTISPGALSALYSITGIAVIMGVLLGVLGKLNVGPTLEIATSLSEVLLAMSVAALILSKISPMASVGITGAASFLKLVAAAAGILAAIGGIIALIPGAEEFLANGIPILENIGKALGALFGGIIAGFGEAVSNSLPAIGKNITSFMDELSKASEHASKINPSSFDGVIELVKALAAVALVSVGTSIADMFTQMMGNGTSMDKFKEDGVAFFEAMKAIGDAAVGVLPIPPIVLLGIGDFIKTLSDVAKNSVGTSIADMFTQLMGNGTSMDKFKEDGVAFFEALKAISDEAAGVTSISTDSLTSVTELIDALGKVAKSTVGVTIGDMFTQMCGEGSTMDKFKEDGVAFFKAINAISIEAKNVEGIPTDSLTSVTELIDALSTVAKSTVGVTIGDMFTQMCGEGGTMEKFKSDGVAFFEAMKEIAATSKGVEIDEKGFSSIVSAATELATLQDSLASIGGVIEWFTGKDDLGTFGENAKSFIDSMVTAATSLGDTTIDPAALKSVIDAAKELSDLQADLENIGGVIDWFSGRSDLGTFGEAVGKFAEAMGKLKEGVGDDGITQATVDSVVMAGTALSQLQEALPEEGWFDGKLNLSDFATYVGDFATAIHDFGVKMAEIDFGLINTAISMAYNVKYFMEAIKDIDTSGVEKFTGIGTGGIGADGPLHDIAKSIADFATTIEDIDIGRMSVAMTTAIQVKDFINQLAGFSTEAITNFNIKPLGEAIKGYSDCVADINPINVITSIVAANNLKTLVSSLATLDTSGISKLSNIKSIGSYLKSYSDSVSGINLATILISVACIGSLIGVVNSISKVNVSGISKFNVVPLGKNIASYSNQVSGVNFGAITSSVIGIRKLTSVINNLAGINVGGVDPFVAAIDKLGTVQIDRLVNAFHGASSKLSGVGKELIVSLVSGITAAQVLAKTAISKVISDLENSVKSKAPAFVTAGSALMMKLSSGIQSKKSLVSSSAKAALSSAVSGIRSYYLNFYNAGSYLVSGFANGISANSYRAAAQARAMAKAAKAAAEKALGIASPSKVFYKIGNFTGMGFVKALKDYSIKSYKAGSEMAKSAKDGLSKSIGNVYDVIKGNVNTQPTIRPVLDLTNVQERAKAISGLLNGNTVELNAKANSISSAMSKRGQNGSNSDVVSAIDKLRKDLGNIGGPSYTINGVTYDDGSNITEAVETIVRAARIGRRV